MAWLRSRSGSCDSADVKGVIVIKRRVSPWPHRPQMRGRLYFFFLKFWVSSSACREKREGETLIRASPRLGFFFHLGFSPFLLRDVKSFWEAETLPVNLIPSGAFAVDRSEIAISLVVEWSIRFIRRTEREGEGLLRLLLIFRFFSGIRASW